MIFTTFEIEIEPDNDSNAITTTNKTLIGI